MSAHDAIWARCAQPVAGWEGGPLAWLSEYTATENPKYIEQRLPFKAPFPRKDYFIEVMDALLTERRLMIPKTREMMTSWEVMGYCAWKAGFQAGAQIICQADKEQKAWGLVEYARILWRNSPAWMQERWGGITDDAKGRVKLGNGAEVIGVPSGESQIRFYHPTVLVLDEAAKLPEAEQCWNAANPVAWQIIAISSAAPGWFANMCDESLAV